jgi:hypothetical protein
MAQGTVCCLRLLGFLARHRIVFFEFRSSRFRSRKNWLRVFLHAKGLEQPRFSPVTIAAKRDHRHSMLKFSPRRYKTQGPRLLSDCLPHFLIAHAIEFARLAALGTQLAYRMARRVPSEAGRTERTA